MKSLFHFLAGGMALATAATLAACGSGSQPLSDPAPKAQVVANDCRAPAAQTAQRGCKPVTRMIATQ